MDAPQEVAATSGRAEAELVRARLAAAGIPAAVLGDDAGGMYPNLGIRGVRVMVSASDLDEARAVLAEPAHEDGSGGP